VGGLTAKTGHPVEATPILRRAVSIDSSRVDADPNNALAKTDLGISYGALADNLTELHQVDEALALDRKAYELRQAMANADPANAIARRGVATAARHLGETLLAAGHFDEGQEWLLKAATAFEELCRADPEEVPLRSRLGQIYAELGDAQASCAQDERSPPPARAEARRTAQGWFQKSEEVRLGLLQQHATVPEYDAVNGAHNATQLAKLAEASP
jgi:tetratricopeptide (TPR) repeat protein